MIRLTCIDDSPEPAALISRSAEVRNITAAKKRVQKRFCSWATRPSQQCLRRGMTFFTKGRVGMPGNGLTGTIGAHGAVCANQAAISVTTTAHVTVKTRSVSRTKSC
jgi:hypothetical protein